jgi:hypothetical protein
MCDPPVSAAALHPRLLAVCIGSYAATNAVSSIDLVAVKQENDSVKFIMSRFSKSGGIRVPF